MTNTKAIKITKLLLAIKKYLKFGISTYVSFKIFAIIKNYLKTCN